MKLRLSTGLALFYVFAIGVAVLAPVLLHAPGALRLGFWLEEPVRMGRLGGVGPVIYSTLLINALTLTFVCLLGLPLAVGLARQPKTSSDWMTRWIRGCLDLLAATPSIVYGLFGFAFFGRVLGLSYSILSGSLTLSLMILPLFVRLVEDALAALDPDLRRTARSLGLSEWTATFKIYMPLIRPALLAALILAWTRAIGETAALLYTSGYSLRWPQSVFESGRSLSVHIFDLSLNVGGADAQAYRAAAVILILTAAFSFLSRFIIRGLTHGKTARSSQHNRKPESPLW